MPVQPQSTVSTVHEIAPNPFSAFIEKCGDEAITIQQRYIEHCKARNAHFKTKLQAPDYAGVSIDPILSKLVDRNTNPNYTDPRNSVALLAKPPLHIIDLISQIGRKLHEFNPCIWLTPLADLHVTLVEIQHSVTRALAEATTVAMGSTAMQNMVKYPGTHPCRLVNPQLSLDDHCIALSFLPDVYNLASNQQKAMGHVYSYHHLRRDLYDQVAATGVSVSSRYVVPSCHLTLSRFISGDYQRGHTAMLAWVALIDELNDWLRKEYRIDVDRDGKKNSTWIIGHEGSVVCQKGNLWYGGGLTVAMDEGMASAGKEW